MQKVYDKQAYISGGIGGAEGEYIDCSGLTQISATIKWDDSGQTPTVSLKLMGSNSDATHHTHALKLPPSSVAYPATVSNDEVQVTAANGGVNTATWTYLPKWVYVRIDATGASGGGTQTVNVTGW